MFSIPWLCVFRYSWSRWFLTHKWSRWSTAWQQRGGGWGSSMLRSLQIYWAAAQLNWVRTRGFITQHLTRRLYHFKICLITAAWLSFFFCTLTRRMPGVSQRRASWADTSGECRAGVTSTCQSPSQHLRGPDYGLDGERCNDCSEVHRKLTLKSFETSSSTETH